MLGTILSAEGTAVNKTDKVCLHGETDDLDTYTYIFQHIILQYIMCQVVIREEVLLEC